MPTCSLRARSPRRYAVPARQGPGGYAPLPAAPGGSSRSLARRCARRRARARSMGGGCHRRGLRGSGGQGLGGAVQGRARRARMCILRVSHNKEVTSVRATTLLSTILAMKHARVEAVALDETGVVADVAPTTSIPRCSGCFCRIGAVYDARPRSWRHLDLAGMRLVLRYRLRRVDCSRCGVRVELVPWAEPGSWFTRDFEEHTAYLAQTTDKTTVVKMMRVAWNTVGEIARRVVDRLGPRDLLDGLKQIGIDELSYRRHHEYVTVVLDHVKKRIVWARPGKDAATLAEFFKELGTERCKQLAAVTI